MNLSIDGQRRIRRCLIDYTTKRKRTLMRYFRRRIVCLLWIMAVEIFFSLGCFATDGMSTFVRLQFGNDVSIEVPRNWIFLDMNIRQHLNNYSEAVVKFAGVDVNQGNNQILVAANAYTKYKKPSATMRLSVRAGSFPTQTEIKEANTDELRREAEITMKKLQGTFPENVKGMKLLDVRVEQLGTYYTIVYDKQVDYVSGPAMDRLDVIYVGSRVYKLNTSYRKSEASMFEPVIRHIRQSLIIDNKRVIMNKKIIFLIIIQIVFCYSIPVIIRYIILRKPILRRVIALLLLIPLYLLFSMITSHFGNKINENIKIPNSNSSNIPYVAILYSSLGFAYYILREGIKKEKKQVIKKKDLDSLIKQHDSLDILPLIIICPSCGSELILEENERKAKSLLCPKCNVRIDKSNYLVKD